MYQLIRIICEHPKEDINVSLLYANQTEDILPHKGLNGSQRKFLNQFSVWYVLNTAPPGWKYGQGFITKGMKK